MQFPRRSEEGIVSPEIIVKDSCEQSHRSQEQTQVCRSSRCSQPSLQPLHVLSNHCTVGHSHFPGFMKLPVFLGAIPDVVLFLLVWFGQGLLHSRLGLSWICGQGWPWTLDVPASVSTSWAISLTWRHLLLLLCVWERGCIWCAHMNTCTCSCGFSQFKILKTFLLVCVWERG